MAEVSLSTARPPGRFLGRLIPQEPVGFASALAAAVVLWTALGWHFWHTEGTLANILFTAATTLAVAAALAALTRRPVFATIVTAGAVTIIAGAAHVKRATMDMVVHAYDIFFYLSSWSTVSYLLSDHTRLVVAMVAALAVFALLGWLAFRCDPTRVKRGQATMAMVLFGTLAGLGAELKGERRHMQFYFSNLYVSSFYASWGETLQTLWHGSLIEAAARSPVPQRLAIPANCNTTTKPPHVVLIHQESIVPPGHFPTLSYDKSVDPMFKSQDGVTRRMRVETYGGASWLTEFSILAGVSTQAFGGMRQFVQTFMQNRLQDTLPQSLERCGYRNVVFYPMLKNFVSNDKFYASVGLREIFDLKAQKAPSAHERDQFYYGNALIEMDQHFKTSEKPLFTYIQTMSAHWPYDWTFMPELQVPGGGPGTYPEMHEYLRRVSIAKIDYDWFKAELKKRFPDRPILIVHYGDHHPTATRTLIGFKHETEAEDVVFDANSLGFITYYTLDGHNYQVPKTAMPPNEVVDVPYLGTIILDAAGLPLSPAQVERKRLMALCDGRYDTCKQRKEILSFHRRLIDSGILVAR